MKKNVLLALIALSLTSCETPPTQPTQAQASAHSWAYELVNWNNHIYKVTSEHVYSVGGQIGAVTHYSDLESTSQTGIFSNAFPVGTKLFAILHVPTDTAFAVQTKNGYVKAVDLGVYGQRGNEAAGNNSLPALPFLKSSDVKSIKWDNSSSGKPNHIWTSTHDASTTQEVVGWFNSANVIELEPIGPVPMSAIPGMTINTLGGKMDVSLAYNVTTVDHSDGTSQTSWIYQRGYVVISGHSLRGAVRVYSPPLANWIWNGWYGTALPH